MLNVLQIENIATIEAASVEFSPGLNVLTGETGAGKSILIDSINAVLGAKTSRELIRTGAAGAAVSALFSETGAALRDKLEAMGLPTEEDGSLQLRRKLMKDGKNSCFVNGAPVTVSMLKSIAEDLIAIHGQRDAQTLLLSERHVDYLDAYAGDGEALAEYRACFSRCRSLKKEIEALTMDEAEKARRLDLLRYQVDELTGASPKPGETEALRKKKKAIQNAEKARKALRRSIVSLTGDGETSGADALISDAVRALSEISSVASGVSEVASGLEQARDTVSDAAAVLDDALESLAGGEAQLEAIEERLDLLYRLSKKYGPTETEMLSFLADAEEQLRNIEFADEKIDKLTAELEKAEEALIRAGETLTDARKAAGERLSAIREELTFLDMPRVVFLTDIQQTSYHENGRDEVVFLLSANPGEEPRPLNRVASGGELSRVMLAMKNALRSDSSANTMIFDEIDAGVSGSAAGKIALKLSALSVGSQVLCVTHSAQIAAFADVHKRIRKSVNENKNYTVIDTLTEEERAPELARITFGPSPTQTQIASARQMLASAASVKANGQTVS